jgi:hypothetical protein
MQKTITRKKQRREKAMRRLRPVDVVVLATVIALVVVSRYFGWIGPAIVE